MSLTALCTNSPCSRADTSQRLGCNYTPLSAPSLCPGEGRGKKRGEWRETDRQTDRGKEGLREGEMWKEKEEWRGGDKMQPLCVCAVCVRVCEHCNGGRHPNFCTRCQKTPRHPKKKKKKDGPALLPHSARVKRF